MKKVRSWVEVDAAPATVWAVLADFDTYPEWNPVEISMKGEPVTGTVLEHTQRLTPDGKARTFRPTIVAATPGEELAWRGKVYIPGVFDVLHRFWLEPLDDGRRTRLHQDEDFSGLLVPLSGKAIGETERAFAIANTAIKARAESREQS